MTTAAPIPKENWFSSQEYARRLEAVRAAMSAAGLDALLVFSPANVYYLTGHHSIDTWEFRAVIITHDRTPRMLLFQFERGRFLASSWLEEGRFYQAGDAPGSILAQMLREMELTRSRVGVESADPALLEALRSGGAHVEPVSRIVDQVRLCKSDEELTCIRKAAEFTAIGMRAAREAAVEGARDGDVAAAATAAMLRAGSHHPVMPPTVASGFRSGISHSAHDGAVLTRRDSVFIELSGCHRHYSAPLMHTLTVGPASDEWRAIRDIAHDVADVIIQTARLGVRACDVAIAARKGMRGIEDRVQFHYNFGYSVGASFPPHWLEESGFHIKENNPAPLRAGMVFHVPLTMRVLGRFASGTSRTIHITDGGAAVLTGGREDDA